MRLRYGLFLAFTVACGSSTSYSSSPPPAPPPGPPPPPPPPGSTGVTISDYRFSPDSVMIRAGTNVMWTNQGVTHTVTADNGTFDSGSLAGPMPDGYGGMTTGGTYSHTFSTPGTFTYHCSVHPTQMKAVLVVTQ